MPLQPILSVQAIHCCYGPIEVLHGVSLVVNEAELVALIGANGAGKSTILRSISGLLSLSSGSIEFDNQIIKTMLPHQLVAAGLAHVPEGRKIFSQLSVKDNLLMGAFTRSNTTQIKEDLDHAYSLFPILAERQHQLGGTLSGGEQQMLAIGRALMSRPKLILMDEPSMGVAPMLVLKIFEVIKDLNQQGTSILLVEQSAHLALKLANRAYVLETGRITLSGSGTELLQDQRVREAYLGA